MGTTATWQADHCVLRFIDHKIVIDRFPPLWTPAQLVIPYQVLTSATLRVGPSDIAVVELRLSVPMYGSTVHLVGFTTSQGPGQRVVLDYLQRIAEVNAHLDFTARQSVDSGDDHLRDSSPRSAFTDLEETKTTVGQPPTPHNPDLLTMRAASDSPAPTSEQLTQRSQSQTLSPATFVALDVETANADYGSICAIGIAVVRCGLVAETYSWLCQPPRSASSFDRVNIAIHGITAAAVRGQPRFHERMKILLDIIGDAPIVCHNARFDMRAIRCACILSRLPIPNWRFGCTYLWSREHVNGLDNYRLPTVAAHFGAILENHHDAAEDAVAAANIMLGLLNQRSVETLDDYVESGGGELGELTDAGIVPCSSVSSWRPGRGVPEHPYSCELARQRRRQADLLVRERDIMDWRLPIEQLKRFGENAEALEILLECVAVAEHRESRMGGNPDPWFTEQAAIVYRKLKDGPGERRVLERWFAVDPPIVATDTRGERLLRVRLDKILAKSR
ncbi:exonuclease domain-containing protein [Nocardia terpenica]|uniref:Exonuclease domain-containing protein n=1 Tax=Nocardia terpenica TaxID=455432 RepID=A0A6G9Z7W6_9NOCA|nr:exonuclease domain-containing protein [Nocardia terpenica]QIS21520.1 hypothetical protein F6W96_27480 [Nocardia terpenica]